ncbi:CpaD family pilus assembly lipoprotein [Paraburkholderia caballeronis]|uniref:Pilus biogenesis CpaD protein (Pilus_cpaD) n=1 Tax=Paraburkholderia caballeronis TaxID=416943 RepID=A0A1H7RRI1_9BURK|nr:CpaD family pilus assembly lipoprotein [Paraburkholderia caballeronis]PXW23177.1 pilus biogenesis CpaD protein [Paraburkholderia caballeronis]PXW97841.1 pilus biogenesis CpaD protein [Paraburkholderia caballeronis]RAJ94811.1 pilus biogenesis CpaD protein [Paraburkholderia caballeronis]TDV11678.1 pilus biogenesis CpaD protein [Paraburkholderia caballeronis]TDV14759.1 pilus biogenesis CpaD protein [Paraburkholderia caballeronis]
MISRHTIRSIAAALAALALGGCFKPPFDMPDASVIGYDGRYAVPPDCRKLAVPAGLTDAGRRRPAVEWGCATYTNLAAQIANPRDLVEPGPLGPADAPVAASAVWRYENDKLTPLDKSSSRDAK